MHIMIRLFILSTLCIATSCVEAHTLTTNKASYSAGENIIASFSRTGTANAKDWIGIYVDGQTPGSTPSQMWLYVCNSQSCSSPAVSSGSLTFGSANPVESGTQSWPLTGGNYDLYYLHNDGYTVLAGPVSITVAGSSSSSCITPTTAVSSNTHLTPTDGTTLTKVAFGSCYKPSAQISNALWNHVRNTFGAQLWVWLGDNMYGDTSNDMEYKRVKYNEARNNGYYTQYGPIASPKIPVTGTWDDHDYSLNNNGKSYACRKESQTEFVHHFNIPTTDPRHPNQGANQRQGVYSANMFAKPGGGNGIHVITLDARYHRSPSFSTYGTCEGASSSLLGATQWSWLDTELAKTSDIKIIASGIQVLPPTDQTRALSSYCAYDGPGGTFSQAISAVGESSTSLGTSYESWGEFPQERAKLLQKAQKAINDGKAKKIVFISGDQHWAEIMAKTMPASATYGAAQTLYEVTASGIDQNWNEAIPNSNRLRVRTADTSGNGVFDKECNFPFIYQGVSYSSCTTVGNNGIAWCSTKTDSSNNHVAGQWGNCLSSSLELYQSGSYSKVATCTDQYSHICTAQANYGQVEVDFTNSIMKLRIIAPHASNPIAFETNVSF